MENPQQRVKTWMQSFEQETPQSPTQLDEKTCKLRAALILEEALETIIDGLGLQITFGDKIIIDKSSLKNTKIEFDKESECDLEMIADGVADLAFVGYGTAVAAGIDMQDVEIEVFNSNMSKLWELEDFDLAVENNFFPVMTKCGEKVLVRRPDGKIVKSPKYIAAEIKQIIEKQKNN